MSQLLQGEHELQASDQVRRASGRFVTLAEIQTETLAAGRIRDRVAIVAIHQIEKRIAHLH